MFSLGETKNRNMSAIRFRSKPPILAKKVTFFHAVVEGVVRSKHCFRFETKPVYRPDFRFLKSEKFELFFHLISKKNVLNPRKNDVWWQYGDFIVKHLYL